MEEMPLVKEKMRENDNREKTLGTCGLGKQHGECCEGVGEGGGGGYGKDKW